MKSSMNRVRVRRGATTVESAVVLLVLLLLIFGALDVGLAVVRYNAVSEAARRAARSVIVRGNKATHLGSLGPSTLSITAADSHPVADSARTVLPSMIPAEVDIQVQWLDGDNRPNRRIRVEVNYVHVPLTFVMLGWGGVPLKADSTMIIAH